MKKQDAIKRETPAATEEILETELPNPNKKDANQNAPTIVNVRNINRNHHRGVTYILVAMVIMYVMSVLLNNSPELAEKYPWIFWVSKLYLLGAEAVSALLKLLCNLLYDLVPINHGWFEGLGDHIVENFNIFVKALETLWHFLAF